MANLILLFLCLGLGIFFRKARLFPQATPDVLNAFVLNISLTALSLYYIPKIELSAETAFPVLVAWIGIFAAVLIFVPLSRILGWRRSVTGAIILCAGFGNTSFVGIPVIQSLYGESGIKTVMLTDQPGSFVALSTVGIVLANLFSGGKISAAQVAGRVLKFPPFLAFAVGLLLNISDIHIPGDLDEVLGKLGATTVPLALVSVGFQLRMPKMDAESRPVVWGLFFKLFVFPMIIFALYFLVFGMRGEVAEICVLQAGMAPMITAGIIASAHKLEPKLCNLMIGVGIPLSFMTLAGWYVLMQFLYH